MESCTVAIDAAPRAALSERACRGRDVDLDPLLDQGIHVALQILGAFGVAQLRLERVFVRYLDDGRDREAVRRLGAVPPVRELQQSGNLIRQPSPASKASSICASDTPGLSFIRTMC
jgi:hypothetical protein